MMNAREIELYNDKKSKTRDCKIVFKLFNFFFR